MSPAEPRTRTCTAEVRIGRMRKAEQFAEAFDIVIEFADQPGDLADACATMAIHAGIAAADVVCCTRLGRHSLGENHNDAVTLLATVDPDLAKHLRALLGLKTLAGYGHDPITHANLVRAQRAMTALLSAARTLR